MTSGDGSLAELAIASEGAGRAPRRRAGRARRRLRLSAIAAWMSPTWRARLQPGESVLVLGAGGVVGQVALQAARILGAGRVVAAARSADSRERAMSYAADDVVELRADDDVAGLAARLGQACGGHVSVVIDPLSEYRDPLQPRCWRKVVVWSTSAAQPERPPSTVRPPAQPQRRSSATRTTP